MATTDNGWSASPSLPTRPLVVAGEAFSPGVRDHDDVHTVLEHVAVQLHERVEPIVRDGWHQADDWGFSYRENRNSPNSLSRHSGGIAIDYNATRHPNGVPTTATFTTAQIREVHQILAELDGVVRWGGDYHGTPDAMHFEIDTPPNSAALTRVAARLRTQEDDMPFTEKELRKIIRGEVDDAIADAAETIKVDVGRKGKWSLETVLSTLVNRKKRQES